jgi:hypothetical protein
VCVVLLGVWFACFLPLNIFVRETQITTVPIGVRVRRFVLRTFQGNPHSKFQVRWPLQVPHTLHASSAASSSSSIQPHGFHQSVQGSRGDVM